MKEKELKALISLLDDPDDTIFGHVKSKLMAIGSDIIPVLEESWDDISFAPVFQERIENIIHTIQFEKVKRELSLWFESKNQDLLEGALLVSNYQYPNLNRQPIDKLLKTIEKDVWLELNDNLTALEKVKVINHLLYDVHGFSGNSTNYHSAQNSCINTVVESRTGTPVLLSIIFIIIAQRLGLPVYGVNLPRHFILAYTDIQSFYETDKTILFYINPFSNGTVLSRREVQHFLKQLKLEEKPHYFSPCSNSDIICRVINNLMYSYELEKQESKVNELKELLEIITIK